MRGATTPPAPPPPGHEQVRGQVRVPGSKSAKGDFSVRMRQQAHPRATPLAARYQQRAPTVDRQQEEHSPAMRSGRE